MRLTPFILTFALLLAGCAGLPRYTAATPRFTGASTHAPGGSVVILFEPIFPGKPLPETVVDNAVGAFWSPEEATQIGFTQHYGETLATRGPQLGKV